MNRSSIVCTMMICGVLLSAWMILGNPQASFAQDDLVDLVVGFLGDEDKEVRSLAFEQIRNDAKGEAATKIFAAQLPKLAADAQVGLLSALADRGDKAAGPAVLALLEKDADQPVKLAAIRALGRLGQPADHAVLIQLLTDGAAEEQAAASEALVFMSGDTVSADIAGKLKSSPPSVAVALLKVLTTRRAQETIPTILAAAAADDAAVRAAAMKALSQLAGPDHIGPMVTGVLKAERGAERSDAEKAVAMVCQQIENVDERAKPVLAAMEGMEPDDGRIVMLLLGRVGGTSALKVVSDAIASSDSTDHSIGLQALCNWPDASIESLLLAKARIEKRPEHRRMALRALIRIATLSDDRTDEHRLDLLRTCFAMAETDDDRTLVLHRAQAVRTVESLRYITQFMEDSRFAERACLTIVELAHHRSLREPNRPEFEKVLDQVIATSKDPVVVDRSQRYKRDETWVRPSFQ
jgi:HEAT repeat protein